AQPAQGADALCHLRTRVGLRLGVQLELSRRLHRLPAPQDGGRRGGAAAAHSARGRIRAANRARQGRGPGVSFRGRIALAAAAAVAIAVVLASLLVYLLTAGQLHSQVDNQLRSRAHETRRLERLFAVGALKIGANGAASINVSAPSAFAIAAKEAESDISSKLHENGKDSKHKATIETLPAGISR